MGFGAGQIVYEDDLTAIKPTSVNKSGTTARSSTTTLADDPDLSGITLTPGTYSITVTLFFTVASTTPLLKTRWAFTGTWGSPMRSCMGPGQGNTAESNALNLVTMRGYDATTQDAIYNKAVSSAYGAIVEQNDKVVVTATGLFSVQWAQSVSNASAVTMQSSSSILIEAIGS